MIGLNRFTSLNKASASLVHLCEGLPRKRYTLMVGNVVDVLVQSQRHRVLQRCVVTVASMS